MTVESDHGIGEAVAARIERRWATLSIVIVGLLVGMATFIGIHQATMPQGRVETSDPKTLHLSGEFVESNLGSTLEADGSVTVRAVGQQYSFTPQCIVVPADTPITLRATSADVVHGADFARRAGVVGQGFVADIGCVSNPGCVSNLGCVFGLDANAGSSRTGPPRSLQ